MALMAVVVILDGMMRPVNILLAEDQAHHAAAADVGPGAQAVPEQLPVLAAGVLQRILLDRHE